MADVPYKLMYATVKYKDGKVEDVPVVDISDVDHSKGYARTPFLPKSCADLEAGKWYSVRTATGMADGRKHSYYARIGRIAASKSELRDSKRVNWPVIRSEEVSGDPLTSGTEEELFNASKVLQDARTVKKHNSALRWKNDNLTLEKLSEDGFFSMRDGVGDAESSGSSEKGLNGKEELVRLQERVKVLEGELRKERASSKLREEELRTAKDDELFFEKVEAMISSKMEALRESLAEEIAGAICARMSPLLSDRGSSSRGASSDGKLALDGEIPSAESSKVLIGDVWCSGGSYKLLKCNPGNLSLWHNALLTGCYAEPHKMRVRKTANTEKFSRKFLVAAQDLYMEWLEGCKGEGGERKYSPSKVVELVADLPRKLAECATNMGPKRGIDARIKAAVAEGRSPNEVLAMVSPKARAKFEERQVVRQAKRTADDLLGQAEAPSDKQARACEDQGSERGSFRDHSPVGSPVSPPPTSPVLPPPTGGMNF
ncbi:uncharacterized protein LOC124172386 [Ischnura elegans]|uniref:uncharacterized protein LOC124172386 n=1 Tax=Ischnura elegans TaxID=197161 RepID=UPI001ED8AFEA|nr:uncharacterized protein LOC124172386 [Ischnura elegans]